MGFSKVSIVTLSFSLETNTSSYNTLSREGRFQKCQVCSQERQKHAQYPRDQETNPKHVQAFAENVFLSFIPMSSSCLIGCFTDFSALALSFNAAILLLFNFFFYSYPCCCVSSQLLQAALRVNKQKGNHNKRLFRSAFNGPYSQEECIGSQLNLQTTCLGMCFHDFYIGF